MWVKGRGKREVWPEGQSIVLVVPFFFFKCKRETLNQGNLTYFSVCTLRMVLSKKQHHKHFFHEFIACIDSVNMRHICIR